MTNVVHDSWKTRQISPGVDMMTSDFRVAIVMTNSTVAAELDKTTLAGFTTIDEYDGIGYAAGGVALVQANYTLTQDNVNHRGKFDCTTDPTWASLAAGTRGALGFLLYLWTGTFNGSRPVGFFDNPFNGNGSPVTLQFSANGVYLLS